MSAVQNNIVLEIDSICFEGLSSYEARQAGNSFELALTGIINQQGLPLGWQSNSSINLDLSGFEAADSRPRVLGESLAQFIYERANR